MAATGARERYDLAPMTLAMTVASANYPEASDSVDIRRPVVMRGRVHQLTSAYVEHGQGTLNGLFQAIWGMGVHEYFGHEPSSSSSMRSPLVSAQDPSQEELLWAVMRTEPLIDPAIAGGGTLLTFFADAVHRETQVRDDGAIDLVQEAPLATRAGREFVIAGWLGKILAIDTATTAEDQATKVAVVRRAIENRYGVDSDQALWAINFAFDMDEQPQRIADYGRLVLDGFRDAPADAADEAEMARAVAAALSACVSLAGATTAAHR